MGWLELFFRDWNFGLLRKLRGHSRGVVDLDHVRSEGSYEQAKGQDRADQVEDLRPG